MSTGRMEQKGKEQAKTTRKQKRREKTQKENE